MSKRVEMKVEGHDCRLSNYNELKRVEHITDIAIITRGLTKISDERRESLYKELLVEAYMGTANRIFEFLPVVLDYNISAKGNMVDLFLRDSETYGGSPFGFISAPDPRDLETISKQYNWVDLLELFKFSYVDTKNSKIYTNMRALLKFGIKYENIPYNKPSDLTDFKLVEFNVPFFVWNQLYTHTTISKVSESDRVSRNEVWDESNVWLPKDVLSKVQEFASKFENRSNPENEKYFKQYNDALVKIAERFADVCNVTFAEGLDEYKEYLSKFKFEFETEKDLKFYLMNDLSQTQLEEYFQMIGYPKETSSRAIYMMRIKKSYFAGWKNDPYVWQNLIGERTSGWTQGYTKEAAAKLDKIFKTIGDDIDIKTDIGESSVYQCVVFQVKDPDSLVVGGFVDIHCSTCRFGEACNKDPENKIHCFKKNKSLKSDYICKMYEQRTSETEKEDEEMKKINLEELGEKEDYDNL